MLFVESPESEEEMRTIGRAFDLPLVANMVEKGRTPLTLELLSPADRPVQITRDLPGFWQGTWAEVRKDMAGRYPKHSWPEDPNTAEAQRRPTRKK